MFSKKGYLIREVGKKLFLAVVVAIAATASLKAQDLITKMDGSDIQAKITEVNPDNVKYKRWDYLDGPTYTIMIEDILIIRYSNGTNQVFNRQATQPANNNQRRVEPQQRTDTQRRAEERPRESGKESHASNSSSNATLVPLTMSSIDTSHDVAVLGGTPAFLKQDKKVFVELDFSNCIVEDKPLDDYLAGRGEDFVRDWPDDVNQIANDFIIFFNKRCKPMKAVENKNDAEYILTVHILQMETGYFNPIVTARWSSGAALWGIAEFTDSNSGSPELVLSLNEVRGFTNYSETVRISIAFGEFARRMGKLKK